MHQSKNLDKTLVLPLLRNKQRDDHSSTVGSQCTGNIVLTKNRKLGLSGMKIKKIADERQGMVHSMIKTLQLSIWRDPIRNLSCGMTASASTAVNT